MNRFVGLAVAVVGLVNACGGTPGPSITAEEARKRVDQHLQQTLRAVPSELRFAEEELPDYEAESGSGCTRPLEGSGFTGQVKVTVEYFAEQAWPRGEPMPGAVEHFLGAVRSHWDNSGYRLDGDKDNFHADAGGVRLRAKYYLGELAVSGSSACVWPNGTPES